MSKKRSSRRPGPFGPAKDLLPAVQEPFTIHQDAPAWDALDRMRDSNFSQLPVIDDNGHVVGVFSWKCFAMRTLDYRGHK
ncbi:MAG: CBS domain-containing protein, partial [Planctomycetota bacterium]